MSNLWSYTTGSRGVNRIRVYERRESSFLYIEWYDDDGRHQKSLKTTTGHPITTEMKREAKLIADRLAAAQLKKRRMLASQALGLSKGWTLQHLLEQYHHDKEFDWRPSHKRGQERFRRFWLKRLGASTMLTDVTPGGVERIAREEAKARNWSNRTHASYLRYIVDAFSYGQKKLKAITESHNLSAVTIPNPDSKSKAYSRDEVRRLIPALYEVDLRAGVLGDLCYQTGRRLSAILRLDAADIDIKEYEQDGDTLTVGLVAFAGAHDKAHRAGSAVVVGRALEGLVELLGTTAVQTTGWLFPDGKLENKTGHSRVSSETAIKEWLPAGEERAGITHVSGRAWHGIKRRFATDAEDRGAASWQSGTDEDTLKRIYEQDDLAPKVGLALQLANEVD